MLTLPKVKEPGAPKPAAIALLVRILTTQPTHYPLAQALDFQHLGHLASICHRIKPRVTEASRG
ncbi:hypothetical protein CONPUDRAFT_90866 [Coniophora puteana RWD-64-598 SS2]|uniref:Uncharacterized protein n=1 Tax=Coniophora puteana (strain RWD-64-598) TaxID=741705 RepID=A0A5M3MK97_CONPW|nr:uncharacterized protein CONPUDRAFT_90866 [Coniophora puteana RWD-64-598 SS2]EIW79447.1 hypothetical protein CONPUDRAFT_90866 [Coniophora puteana RWD-64-598 SS2]